MTKHVYYDCRIVAPSKYKSSRSGMHWTERSKKYAITTMRLLLKLAKDKKRKMIGEIRIRQKGDLGNIKTFKKLPLFWQETNYEHITVYQSGE